MQPLDPNLEAWLKLVTLIGGLIAGCFAFFKWIHEVRQARALREQELMWKQKAALIERLTAFADTPGAYNAVLMLGSPERDVPLWAKEKPEERYVRVTWEEVAEAMVPEDVSLPSKLSAIRDSFGDFLTRLSHIELYRGASLLNTDDVRIFALTWASKISLDKPHARHIRLFIRSQNLHGVERLLREAGGLDISSTWEADNTAYSLDRRSKR